MVNTERKVGGTIVLPLSTGSSQSTRELPQCTGSSQSTRELPQCTGSFPEHRVEYR
jgi:hypothetical protein